MTHAFPNYRNARLAIEDARDLEERLVLNWRALSILHIEMGNYPAEWQRQWEPWFTSALKWHGLQTTHIYGELWMGNEMEWQGFEKGLVRKPRSSLAAPPDKTRE